jgi:hypothetical protein
MAVAFVQSLGSNQSKAAGTSLAIAVASLSVTVGNDIFVAFASDVVGTLHAVTDNLGNTYSLRRTDENPGQVRSQLWRSTITTGGTLTSITESWTTNITAKAMVAGEFSGLGIEDGVTGNQNDLSENFTISQSLLTWQTGDLLVGAVGWEGPATDAIAPTGTVGIFSTIAEVGQNGTTGGGAATNITCTLNYYIASANPGAGNSARDLNSTSARGNAGSGGVYSPAAAPAGADPYPYVRGGYYPTEG